MNAPALTGFSPPAGWIRWTALLLIILGVGLRLRQYEANRSLWGDESMLALNIVEGSAADLMLMKPLAYNQSTPPFFLLAEKAITGAFGNSEYALRLLPLAGGILALLLMWIAARRFIGGAGALTALALFAVSERLVYYSSEVKQYSTDAAIALALLLIGHRCVSPAMRPRDYLLLGVAGAVALWSSHPAAFVLAGIGLAAGLDLLARRDMRRVRWLLATVLLWSGGFAILYFVSLRFLIANEASVHAWTNFFMPMPPWLHGAWFQKSFVNLIRGFVGIPYSGLAAAILLAGCVSLAFRNWRLAVILIAPFPVALLASGLRMYPFGNRLLLFSLPLLFLLIGETAERVRSLLLRLNHAAAWAAWTGVTAALLYSPVCVALQNARTPNLGEHIRPTLAYLSERRQSGDAIYVYYSSVPAIRFYATQFGINSNDYIISLKSRKAPEKYAEDLTRLAGRERVWFVFSHPCRWCPVDEEALFLQNLDGIGVRIDEFKAPGAAVYLYDLHGRQEQPAPR